VKILEEKVENGDGKLYAMPYYPPQKITEIEINAHGASYKYVRDDIEKIYADNKDCTLRLKIVNLGVDSGTEFLKQK